MPGEWSGKNTNPCRDDVTLRYACHSPPEHLLHYCTFLLDQNNRMRSWVGVFQWHLFHSNPQKRKLLKGNSAVLVFLHPLFTPPHGEKALSLMPGRWGEGSCTAPHCVAIKGAAKEAASALDLPALSWRPGCGREVGPELQPENPGPHVGKFWI